MQCGKCRNDLDFVELVWKIDKSLRVDRFFCANCRLFWEIEYEKWDIYEMIPYSLKSYKWRKLFSPLSWRISLVLTEINGCLISFVLLLFVIFLVLPFEFLKETWRKILKKME